MAHQHKPVWRSPHSLQRGGHGLLRIGGGALKAGVDLMAEILPEVEVAGDPLKASCISHSHIGLDAVGEALMALNLGTAATTVF